MKTKTSTLLGFGLCLLVLPLGAQDSAAPSMNPEAAQEARVGRSPLGLDGLSQERPANAVTEITAKETATFDSADNAAEFIGSVVVKDPQFHMTCDRMKAFMNENRRGLQRVEAYGNVVIRQENTDTAGNSTVSIARAGKAIFTPENGDITLIEWPQIQQGINRHISTGQDTRMIINREGRIKTEGGSKTMITDMAEGGF